MALCGDLDGSIRNVLELQHFSTFDEVSSLAYKVELQKKAKFKREPSKPPQRTYPTFNKGSFPPPPLKPQNSPLTIMRNKGATNAKGFKHVASDCPNRRVITMVEYRALEEVELVEGGSDVVIHLMVFEEECLEEADERELLVLRRALSGQKGPNHDEQ